MRPEPRSEASGCAPSSRRWAAARAGRPDRPAVRAQRRHRPGRARPEARRRRDRADPRLHQARRGAGLDWAQNAANHFQARDQWERLLTAGLARDFEQLRWSSSAGAGPDPKAAVDQWVIEQGPRIEQFRNMVERARTASVTTAPMLAQIATQGGGGGGMRGKEKG